MIFFQKFSGKLAPIMLSISFCLASGNFIYSDQFTPDVRIDGSGNVAAVWLEDDGANNFIQGLYGPAASTPAGSPVEISNPGIYNAANPILLATSTGTPGPGGASAVAIYSAIDTNTGNSVILASIATTSGWNTTPVLLSADDGSEYPNTDYRVTISDDGTQIVVNWSAYLITPGQNLVRFSVSTDGGATFTGPTTAPS